MFASDMSSVLRPWLAASTRLVRCIAHARLVCHPIHLPGFASIVGIGLFEVGGVRIGIAPNEADVDELAVQCICAVELAAPALELTDLGTGVHGTVFAVGPVDAPLARFRVIEAESQSLDVAAGTIEFDLLDHGTSVPHFARDEGAIELDPCVRPSEGTLEPL